MSDREPPWRPPTSRVWQEGQPPPGASAGQPPYHFGEPTGGPAYPGPAYGYTPYPEGQPGPQRNTLGIVALAMAIVGTIFACIPGIMIVGWFLLPCSFILGIIGLTQGTKRKGTAIAAVIISIIGTLVGIIAFLAFIGTAFDSGDASDVTAARATDSGSLSQPDQGSATEDTSYATRANPAAMGETLTGEEWEIVVNSFTRNATAEVMAENMFNDPPPPGSQWALVNLTATYVGEDSGLANFIGIAFVTDAGIVIEDFDHAVVTPDPVDGELYPGGTITGNFALAVPENEPGTIRLDLTRFGEEVFVAVN